MSLSKLIIPSVPVEASETLTLVELPKLEASTEWVAVMAGLVSTLSQPCLDQRANVELVFNLLCFGVPAIRAHMGGWGTVKVKTVRPSRAELLAWAGMPSGEKETNLSHLPMLPGPVVADAFSVGDEKAIFLVLASLLFCIGKQASESAKASVLDNRPDALIRRFELREDDQIILPGRSAGPSRSFLEQIYNSFANYTEVRASAVVVFLGWRKEGTHLPINLEILMTNFNLLRGTGMTHVEAIVKLVQMHPWTLKVPELEPYFHKFTRELERWEQIDPAVRPYHRLLVPQSEYMFLSAEYRPLIAVAGSFIEEVEKTFGGYVYNKAAYSDLVDRVRSYVPGYQPTAKLSKLATLLGVADEPLPQVARSLPTPQSSTV